MAIVIEMRSEKEISEMNSRLKSVSLLAAECDSYLKALRKFKGKVEFRQLVDSALKELAHLRVKLDKPNGDMVFIGLRLGVLESELNVMEKHFQERLMMDHYLAHLIAFMSFSAILGFSRVFGWELPYAVEAGSWCGWMTALVTCLRQGNKIKKFKK